MNISELASQANDALTVRRVFGEPIERNGITIIPVASVLGGGGGGEGSGPVPSVAAHAAGGPAAATGSGSGGGFGVRATPAGVYVIRGDSVSWQPALNVTPIALMGQLVAIVGLLVLRSIVRARSRS